MLKGAVLSFAAPLGWPEDTRPQGKKQLVELL
jgi:hypothetical protein